MGFNKNLYYFSFILILSSFNGFTSVVLQHYSGTLAGYHAVPASIGREEIAYLRTDGPAKVLEIDIYLGGGNAGLDTFYIIGDPTERDVPPAMFVTPYNQLANPIYVNFDGVAGWRTFVVADLRIEGNIRVGLQHRIKANGPRFGVSSGAPVLDNAKYMSYLFLPAVGVNGTPAPAAGDYMITFEIEYDYPDVSGLNSLPTPFQGFVEVTNTVGLLDSLGGVIEDFNSTVTDWNGDGYEDINIASFFFQNNGNGTFTNVTDSIGIDSVYSICWADYDNDGDVDAYVSRVGSWAFFLKWNMTKSGIFVNDGSGHFLLSDEKSTFDTSYPNPSYDYNLVTKTPQDSFHNPYHPYSPLWLDYNNDGWLDLFLGNGSKNDAGGAYFQPDQLWENNKDGSFKRVNVESQLENIQKRKSYDIVNSNDSIWFRTIDATACDYNMDNKVDIHAVHYHLQRDHFFHNNGNDTFVEKAHDLNLSGHSIYNPSTLNEFNTSSYNHGQSVEYGDYNNDGYPDCLVASLAHPDRRGSASSPTMLLENSGPPNYTFEEVQATVGIRYYELIAGVMWADFDNDGYLDLWHGESQPGQPAHIYKNLGAPNYKFKDMSWEWGVDWPHTWGGAKIDYDNDGDWDILAKGRLYRNDIANKGNFLALSLEGNVNDSVQLQGYGSKVIVYAGGKIIYRELLGAKAGYRLSQSSSLLHFGIGNASAVDSIVIIYGNGKKKVICNVAINNYYKVAYNYTDSCPPPSTHIGNIIGPDIKILSIYPNPTSESNNSEFTIKCFIPFRGKYKLQILNVLGQVEVIIIDGLLNEGYYIQTVNNTKLTSGIWFVELTSEKTNGRSIKKLVLTN